MRQVRPVRSALFISAVSVIAGAVGCDSPSHAGTTRAEASSAAPGSPATASAPAASSSTATQSASAPSHEDGPRIYSKRRHVWIFYEPAANGWMGFLGLGSSVRLRSTESRVGDGCAKFYPVEPRGWVCLNEKTTLDPKDPEYLAIKKFAPRVDDPFPHNYGESRGLPRYTYIPTREEQLKKEYKLQEHLDTIAKIRSGELAGEAIPKPMRGVDLTLAGSGPPPELALFPRGIQESRDYIKPLSTIAWSHQFDAEGRTWLVTADLAFVPKDKVTPYPRSLFEGVKLDANTKLPIGFVRYEPRKKYRRKGEAIEASGESWPRLSILPLRDSPPIESGGVRYFELVGDDHLIAEDDVTIARLSPGTPWGAPVQGVSEELVKSARLVRVEAPEGGRRTWVEVSVLGGWMVAYEDTKAVYATLIAPGRGGVPSRGIPPIDTASTPVGTFRVDGKFYTATMANPAFVHSDVPFSQNFSGPHVLHQAYWHDGWGEKRSAGCINLSPKDALWFFHWTEPKMPEGWFGLRSDRQAGPATIVWVHD